MAIPDEETLLAAVKALRQKEPTLARAKVLKQLKKENDWELSEKRLKSCMTANNLNSAAAPVAVLAQPELQALIPRDATYDEVVKKAFQEYTRSEREFLLNLSEADAKALIPRPSLWNEGLNLRIATQQRHHVEILLTLKGIKPCTSIHHHLNTVIYTRL
ncbi:hypothetical protein BDZ45DRAFT_753785 [Acephala macrosclerotiorum]|nr:hypothetical protein BDZ45DRAFT_753785 [Acephala macrosclerotiorum]